MASCCMCRTKRISIDDDDQQQKQQQQQQQQQKQEQEEQQNANETDTKKQRQTTNNKPTKKPTDKKPDDLTTSCNSNSSLSMAESSSSSSSSVEKETADAEEERVVLLTRYATELRRLKENSRFFEEHQRPPHPIPSYRFDELEIGPMLGIGGFCTVREIRGVTLLKDDRDAREDAGIDTNNEIEIDNGNGKDGGAADIECVDVNCASNYESNDITPDNNNLDSKLPTTINTTNTTANTTDRRSGLDIKFANSSTRTYMSQNTLRDSNARYAIKQLRSDLIQPHDYYDTDGNRKRSRKAVHWRGMLDLAIEAQFLSVLSHPNIVKMRGVAGCDPLTPTCLANVGEGVGGGGQGYFLVLDRLFGTLQEVIDDRWKKENKAVESTVSFFGGLKDIFTMDKAGSAGQMKIQMRKEMFLERLTVAYDVSSAFRFLHSKRLIYRDIKSANIGFDVRGDIKIFDFGLCKELPNRSIPATPSTRKTGPLYKLTARTGSRPYMAPEILLGQPYNQKADVFSFGILLYEIFALHLPFVGFTNLDYRRKVFSNIGFRPKLGKKWPTVTKALLEECWDNDVSRRPDFERIASVLKAEMADMVDDLNSNRSGSLKNRTAHLLNRSAASRHNRMMEARAGDGGPVEGGAFTPPPP